MPAQEPPKEDLQTLPETLPASHQTKYLTAFSTVSEQSRHPIDVIARQTGFADCDRMRRAFLRAFGQPPQAIRRNARAKVAA
jgi:AraC-like DNA-binding protein